MTLLSATAYARHRKELGLPGGSQPAVTKAIQAGRLTAPACILNEKTGAYEIDPDLADQQWAENTTSDPKYRHGVKSPAVPPEPREPAQPPEPGLRPVPQNADGARLPKEASMTKAEAQRVREIIKAKREQLAFLEEDKQLGRIVDFEKEARKVAVMVRTNMRAIADRTCSTLAAMNKETDIKEFLLGEIDDALRSLH